MSKNKERRYSLEQIAEQLEWELTDHVEGGLRYWLDDKNRALWFTPSDEPSTVLPDFYDPEHNWRVRDAVKAICVRKAWLIICFYDCTGCFMVMGEWPEDDKKMRIKITKRPEELAWIEALAELKRLEKDTKK